ncbi:MAG: zinc ribbon domain-containing protein [Bacilli bacterium]|nr:zinc ribbon domain-containing protein [Bacilli bacterium]
MKCVKCGNELRNNEKFCTYCGYYNDNENNIEESITTEAPVEDTTDDKWYEEDIVTNDGDDEVELEPVKKEKKEKKPKKEKKEKPKKEKVKKEPKVEEKPVVEEKPKKEKPKKEIKIKEDDEIYYQNEIYIEAYIGEDYKLIKKRHFNIWAFLLNWMYLLYRKLYITGIIGLIITTIVAFFFTKYFLIYLAIVLLLLGFGFNPYYIYIVRRKVDKILQDYEGTDSFSLTNMCKEFGGVSVSIALIIYFAFLIVIVLSIVKPTINTSHNTKFWKENSENEANCSSLVKLLYQKATTKTEKITEALCKIDKKNNKYELYLKINASNKEYYAYYTTENDYIIYKNNTDALEYLRKKRAENRITPEEEKTLNDINDIISNYEIIHKKAKEEDELIKAKRNKEEKLNYIFDYEELIR